jgi:hypothetical protein
MDTLPWVVQVEGNEILLVGIVVGINKVWKILQLEFLETQLRDFLVDLVLEPCKGSGTS